MVRSDVKVPNRSRRPRGGGRRGEKNLPTEGRFPSKGVVGEAPLQYAVERRGVPPRHLRCPSRLSVKFDDRFVKRIKAPLFYPSKQGPDSGFLIVRTTVTKLYSGWLNSDRLRW